MSLINCKFPQNKLDEKNYVINLELNIIKTKVKYT